MSKLLGSLVNFSIGCPVYGAIIISGDDFIFTMVVRRVLDKLGNEQLSILYQRLKKSHIVTPDKFR